MEVRQALPTDLAAVADLARRWCEEGITWGVAPTPRSWYQERLGPYFLVAAEGGHLIGYAVGHTRPSEGEAVLPAPGAVFELDEIYVLPERRREGTGGALLASVMAAATADGAVNFLLTSATKDLAAAMRFYARHGFRPWYARMFRRG